jgi:hypothetical protein
MVFMLSSGESGAGEGSRTTGGLVAGFSAISLSAFLQLKAAATNKKINVYLIFLIFAGE